MGDETMSAMGDDWLLESRQLRKHLGPTSRMKAKVFPVRKSELFVPAAFWLLRRIRGYPREVMTLDVALYADDSVAHDEPLVLAPMPPQSWLRDVSGEVVVDVAGRPEPGRAVALVRGDDVAFCVGPCREPGLFRSRYRL